jgi:hypothetical protein
VHSSSRGSLVSGRVGERSSTQSSRGVVHINKLGKLGELAKLAVVLLVAERGGWFSPKAKQTLCVL